MKETARIADQLSRAYSGKAWHGPSLKYILRGITAQQAAARLIPGAHSIWELVLHIAAWDRAVCERILSGKDTTLPPEQNFPSVVDTSDAAWKKALKKLEQGHRDLVASIQGFKDSKLDRKLGNRDYSFYITMHGAIQHDLYHAGQIAMLKKLTK
jgi:uncharacterized damage-inducible protein DinB